MRVLALASQKGGSGKTTLSGHLAVQASVLYQMNRLWMVVFVIMMVAATQYWMVLWLERRLLGYMGDERIRG